MINRTIKIPQSYIINYFALKYTDYQGVNLFAIKSICIIFAYNANYKHQMKINRLKSVLAENPKQANGYN